MTIVVPIYPERILDDLVVWCEASPVVEPRLVAAVGFAYGYGLNEHQIARIRLLRKSALITADYPLARRAAEISIAPREIFVCDEPDWLATACLQLAKRHRQLGRYLFSERSFGVPPTPTAVRDLVRLAGIRATGYKLTCVGLNRSRLGVAPTAGHELAPFGVGYATSWAARLITPNTRIVMPRRS
jgi:hypothetical protein